MIFKNQITKKLLSLILVLLVLFSSSVLLISCSSEQPPYYQPDSDDKTDDDNGLSDSDYLTNVISPEYKDYERGTIDFSDIKYARPDIAGILTSLGVASSKIESNADSYENIKSLLMDIDKSFSTVLTMYTFTKIQSYNNTSVTYWQDEYSYISTNYSSLVKALDDLKIIAANSTDAEKYGNDIFGSDFVNKYKDKSNESEAFIKLLSEEAALQAEFTALSTSNVTITFRQETNTVDKILASYAKLYPMDSKEYMSAYNACMQEYQEKYSILSADILINLFKVRKSIATEKGFSNYLEYSYSNQSSGYTPSELSSLITSISTYILPIYFKLYEYEFSYYFQSNISPKTTFDKILNNAHDVIKDLDSELYSIYCYMLQHGLYDIRPSGGNRLDSSFTAYLYDYNAPVIFISGNQSIGDYSTLFHEFGHFADFFINNGNNKSNDLSEISSGAMELLTVSALGKKLGENAEKYLLYSAMRDSLETLLFQGFYARFEEKVYKLDLNNITELNINKIIFECAEEFNMNKSAINSLDDIIIPHFITSPMYVQSYITSTISSLEIYFMEDSTAGAGMKVYKDILKQSGNGKYTDCIKNVGLTSPFSENTVISIADKIYYKILGAHYYNNRPPANVA